MRHCSCWKTRFTLTLFYVLIRFGHTLVVVARHRASPRARPHRPPASYQSCFAILLAEIAVSIHLEMCALPYKIYLPRQVAVTVKGYEPIPVPVRWRHFNCSTLADATADPLPRGHHNRRRRHMLKICYICCRIVDLELKIPQESMAGQRSGQNSRQAEEESQNQHFRKNSQLLGSATDF